MKLFVINGPNLNMLGVREPEIYGKKTLADLEEFIISVCNREGIEVELFQSNHEGSIVDAIQRCFAVADGIIINAAAYTHTSVAILDALKAVNLPAVEVHISNINEREEYRKVSYVGKACYDHYMGEGFVSYEKAVMSLKGKCGK